MASTDQDRARGAPNSNFFRAKIPFLLKGSRGGGEEGTLSRILLNLRAACKCTRTVRPLHRKFTCGALALSWGARNNRCFISNTTLATTFSITGWGSDWNNSLCSIELLGHFRCAWNGLALVHACGQAYYHSILRTTGPPRHAVVNFSGLLF